MTERIATNTCVRRIFLQKYGSPSQIMNENDAKSELGRIKSFLEGVDVIDTFVAEYIACRCRFFAEKYPSMRISAIDILQKLVQSRPKGTHISNTNTRFKPNYSANAWERESLNRFAILKPNLSHNTISKKTVRSKNRNDNKGAATPAVLRKDVDIYLVGGLAEKKADIEKACGFAMQHIPVMRTEKKNSKLQALWNGTHMKDFGIIVCLCKHLSHRATGMIEESVKAPSKWIIINAHNDNQNIIAKEIKAALQKGGVK